MTSNNNLTRYNDPQVVGHYERRSDLQPCEAEIFAKHIAPGSSVIDIGVGGGRTTPWLSQRAGRYVGVDYAEAMVAACRKRFPGVEFEHMDATDMRGVPDASFDVVVFSFNGIDTIGDDTARARCFAETHRSILKPGGIYIFSSHNARVLGVWPDLSDARGLQAPWRIVRSIFKSADLSRRALRNGVYGKGQGYIRDPVHGGMDHYVSTPEAMKPQLAAAGFEVVEVLGGRFPNVTSESLTPWHYYACRKIAR